MKILGVLFLIIIVCCRSFAQIKIRDIKQLTPEEAYSNIKVIPMHSDPNSSVFVIYIKMAVKKHLHQYHTEVVTVLEGTGDMYLGGETFKISKGDHLVIPPNTPHAVITTSKTPLKILSVQSPQFLGKDRIFVKVNQ